MTMPLTDAQRRYLESQPVGRLATVGPDGEPQNRPVGFRYNANAGTIDIGGLRLSATRKFRNVEATGRAAFVVDDVQSRTPWRVRGIEIRGRAEALRNQTPPRDGMSAELIRIHIDRVWDWGLDD